MGLEHSTTYLPTMNKRIKHLWVKDLLNPDYEQGKHKLRYQDSYCPLGRLCVLHMREHSRIRWQSFVLGGGSGYTYLGQQTTLPLAVVRWAELEENALLGNSGYDVSLGEFGENRLTQLNDAADIPLDKIAHLINRYL